ncbi:MAG: hypothetical protein KF774_15200 [Planctomyces sp.]|nr:hypothetical protein [Planctomyces sp.]
MLESLSDNQIAQAGCAAALVTSMGIASLSYWLGGARRRSLELQGRVIPTGNAAQDAVAAAVAQARRKAA